MQVDSSPRLRREEAFNKHTRIRRRALLLPQAFEFVRCSPQLCNIDSRRDLSDSVLVQFTYRLTETITCVFRLPHYRLSGVNQSGYRFVDVIASGGRLPLTRKVTISDCHRQTDGLTLRCVRLRRCCYFARLSDLR